MRNHVKRAAIFLALAALTLSCQAIPFLAPTPTPTATNTPTPTNTPTVTPSPTSTNTPTPTFTPTPIPNAAVEELAGGSKLFRDYEKSYALTFPADWLVLNMVDVDVKEVIEDAIADYPDLEDDLEALGAASSVISYRLLALDSDPDHAEPTAPRMNLLFQDQIGSSSLPLELTLEFSAKLLPQIYAGLEVIETKVEENSNGVEVGTIHSVWTAEMPDGEDVALVLLQSIFVTDEGMATITLAVPLELFELVEGEYEAILDSIEVFKSPNV